MGETHQRSLEFPSLDSIDVIDSTGGRGLTVPPRPRAVEVRGCDNDGSNGVAVARRLTFEFLNYLVQLFTNRARSFVGLAGLSSIF